MSAFNLKIPNDTVSSGFLTIVFDINELLIRNKMETSLWIDVFMQTQAFFYLFIYFLFRPSESALAIESYSSINLI